MTLKKGTFSEVSLLSGIAVVMSVITGIFGTPFLRVIRNVYGSLTFWGLVFFVPPMRLELTFPFRAVRL